MKKVSGFCDRRSTLSHKPFSELAWGDRAGLCENSAEIKGVVVSALLGNFGHREVGIGEKLSCLFYSQIGLHPSGRYPHNLGKKVGKSRSAYVTAVGRQVQIYFARKLMRNIFGLLTDKPPYHRIALLGIGGEGGKEPYEIAYGRKPVARKIVTYDKPEKSLGFGRGDGDKPARPCYTCLFYKLLGGSTAKMNPIGLGNGSGKMGIILRLVL